MQSNNNNQMRSRKKHERIIIIALLHFDFFFSIRDYYSFRSRHTHTRSLAYTVNTEWFVKHSTGVNIV